MKIVAIIPAKGNSDRLPFKNIHPIWEKPMLYWAYKACMDSEHDIKVYVSTEDQKVIDVCKKYSIPVVIRSANLSGPMVYKQAVIRDAADTLKRIEQPDLWISLQANSPEIKTEHLDEAIYTLVKYNKDEVFSVDENLMQNAAFRIFKGDYVFQKDLSTNVGVYKCDLMDVHTIEDVNELEK